MGVGTPSRCVAADLPFPACRSLHLNGIPEEQMKSIQQALSDNQKVRRGRGDMLAQRRSRCLRNCPGSGTTITILTALTTPDVLTHHTLTTLTIRAVRLLRSLRPLRRYAHSAYYIYPMFLP